MSFVLENGLAQPVAPQAFAETAPLFFNGFFVPHQGLQLERNFQTYAQLYLAQPWVATVVNRISHAIARLKMNVWDTAPATGNVLKPAQGDGSNGYAKLMANPCPTMPPYQFRLWLASTFEIYGEAFLIKIRNDRGKIIGFLPMHPALTQIFRNQFGELTYRFMGQPNELMSEDMIVPFVSYNPETMMRGISRLEPLRSTLLNEDASRRATATWWKNMGRPSAIMHVDGKLNPKAKDSLKEQLQMMYQGAENTGKVAVLENGSKLEQWQLNSEEMQYIESRKLNREEVCAVYDISPTAVHILDHATFSNVTENLRSVYRDSIVPRLNFLESVFDHHVGSEFNGQLEMRFDVREVMRGDPVARAQMHAQLIQAGVEKPGEARPDFDLGDAGDPAADKLYHQQQLVPLDTPPARAALPTGQSGQQSDDDPKVSTTGTGGGSGVPSVAGRKYIGDIRSLTGRGKSVDDAAQLLFERNPSDSAAIREAYEYFIGKLA